MRHEHHDAIVVGAGIPGSSAAAALAAAGRSVLVIDRTAAAIAGGTAGPVPLERLHADDLGPLDHYAGTSSAWPLDAAELNAWYAKAERLCGYSPEAGAITLADAEPGILATLHRLRAAGLRPVPTRAGTPPTGAPEGCDRIVGRVLRVETDPGGREARAVVVEQEGVHTRHSADIVVLAAGAVGSAAILLRSASDAHVRGLANASGLVGRNLVRRGLGLLLALVKREPPRSIEPGITIADFYLRSPGWRHPGGQVRLVGSSYNQVAAPGSSWPGPHGVRAVHSLDFLMAAEGLPDPDNRVDVGRAGEVTVHWRATNGVALRKLTAQMRHVLGATGSACVQAPVSMHPELAARIRGEAGSGTVRMGTDPTTSVVRPDGRAHDVENLWVVDASTFPSGGAVDPALTQVAVALRAADAIDRALGAPATTTLAGIGAEGRAA